MDIRVFNTRAQARRIKAWRDLIDAVEKAPLEHLWFSDGALSYFEVRFIGAPVTERETGDVYWVERVKVGEDVHEYTVRRFDGARITRAGETETAEEAIEFLASVAS